jgi:hypothetical protein
MRSIAGFALAVFLAFSARLSYTFPVSDYGEAACIR